MNVIVLLEYELAYYDSTVHRFNHYTTRTPPCMWSWLLLYTEAERHKRIFSKMRIITVLYIELSELNCTVFKILSSISIINLMILVKVGTVKPGG